MKQIRKGFFETNSSSVHAIVINNCEPYDLSNIKAVNFSFGEFGWRKEMYKDLESRADYLWTGINHFYEEDKIVEIKKKLLDWFEEDNIVATFRKEICGAFWETGYIDHCKDLGKFLNWVLENKDNLYQYLFAEKNFIQTGNDNGEDSQPYEGLRMRNVDDYLVFVK